MGRLDEDIYGAYRLTQYCFLLGKSLMGAHRLTHSTFPLGMPI